MLIASKSGNISAAKLVSETDNTWTLEVGKRQVRISKSDKQQRAFHDMSDALKWAGAEQELIDHFVELDADKAPLNTSAVLKEDAPNNEGARESAS